MNQMQKTSKQSGLSEPELVTSLSSSAPSLSSVHNSTPVNVTSLPTAAPFQASSGLSEEDYEVIAQAALSDSFHLSDYLDDSQIVTTVRPTTLTPSEIALDLCESALLPEQLECYIYCLSKQYDLTMDEAFMAWKTLKQQCEIGLSETDAVVSVTDLGIYVNDVDETDSEIENHAGILSVSESNLFPESVCSVQPAASSNCHQINLSLQNTSYPGDPDSDILSYPPPFIRKKNTSGS